MGCFQQEPRNEVSDAKAKWESEPTGGESGVLVAERPTAAPQPGSSLGPGFSHEPSRLPAGHGPSDCFRGPWATFRRVRLQAGAAACA